MEFERWEQLIPREHWTDLDLEEALEEQQSLTSVLKKDELARVQSKEVLSKVAEMSIKINGILEEAAKKFTIRMYDIFLFTWHSVLKAFSYTDCTVVGVEILTSNGDMVIVPHVLKYQPSSSATVLEIIQDVERRISLLKHILKQYSSVCREEPFGPVDTIFLFSTESRSESANPLPLSLNIVDSGDKMSLSIRYNTAEFQPSDIDRLLDTFVIVLQQVASDPMKLYKDLTYIPAEEQSQLVNRQILSKDQHYNRTIIEIFEEHVLRHPDTTALIFENFKYTYKELNRLVNQLAHFILSRIHVKPDNVIGICLQQSELVIIAMLGIWKTGAAFASVDYRFPEDRMFYILNSIEAKLVLTDEVSFDKLTTMCRAKLKGCQILRLDNFNFQQESEQNLNVNINIRDVAYVLFTSGTTGTPKGVLIEHKNLSSDCRDIFCPEPDAVPELCTNEVVLMTYYHGFAAFMTCLALTFGEGLTLLLAPLGLILDAPRFYEYSIKHSATQMFATPSMINALDLSNINTLRRVVITGEILREPTFNKIKSSSNSLTVVNGYGCSEAIFSLFTHMKMYTPLFTNPVVNKFGFVLSRSLQCTPVGGIGELCASGLSVARGYLNQEELSAKVFIKNPFEREGFETMVRTGDLARRLPGGAIQYIGRRDFQVKVRGIRVELGEIEVVICSAPGVGQCIVIPKSIGEQKDVILIAYVTGTTDIQAKEESIRDYVKTKLPDYMIPAHIVKLDKFPLNANGKVNRAELLNIPITTTKSVNYVAPSDTRHKMFASIWEDSLELSKGAIGINDNFFGFGGNSILAVRVVNQLNVKLRTAIPATRLLNHPSISEFFGDLEIFEHVNASIGIVSRSKPEYLQLSSEQERFWVWDQYGDGILSFHITLCFEALAGFSLEHFNNAVYAIVRRHEALRTLYKINEAGNCYQSVTESLQIVITSRSIQETDLNNELQMFGDRKYNPSEDLPMEIRIFEVGGNIKYVGIVIHHLAFDFWSRDIFLKELCSFYNNSCCKDALPVLEIQYIDYAQNQRAQMAENDELIAHWKDAMNGYQIPHLPLDRPRETDMEYFAGKKIAFKIEEEISKKLRAVASKLECTLYSVLLAAYFLVIREFSKQDDVIVMSPFAARNHSQIQDIIGLFMRELPLRQKIDSSSSVKEFIRSVWNTVILANEHQSLSPANLVEAIGFTKDPYKDRDLSQVYFQVYESKYDQSGFEMGIPLRIYEDATSLDYPAYNMDLSAILDVSNSEISGFFVYVEQHFDRGTVSKYVDGFVLTLRQFAELESPVQAEFKELCQLTFISKSMFKTKTNNARSIQHGFSNFEILEIPVDSFVPPTTETEKGTCQIWADTLGINADKVGLSTDFFKNGGNGLLGIKVLTSMKNVLGLELSLRQLYLLRTVERVVNYVN